MVTALQVLWVFLLLKCNSSNLQGEIYKEVGSVSDPASFFGKYDLVCLLVRSASDIVSYYYYTI